MTIYREDVLRVGLRSIRAQFKPSVFKQLDHVIVEAAFNPVRVNLLREAFASCKGGMRTWLECPGCKLRTGTIGFANGAWGCNRCQKWHGRHNPWTQRSGKRVSAPLPVPMVSV